MKFKIFRTGKDGSETRYDTFEFEPRPGMTVLGALFHIQDSIDDSLSFRYSCRGAVCGNCAMLINKIPRLACRTQLSKLSLNDNDIELKSYPALGEKKSWDPAEEILIEPLPHLPVLKDLVVDMKKFFQFYRDVEPVFKPGDEEPEKERLMEISKVNELEDYTNCILCAACLGSCPVNGKDDSYKGPAALAKLYRFHIDPREAGDDSRLMHANHLSGWWGCEFHTYCRKVCPKGVPPNLAIGKARAEIKKMNKVPSEIQE